MAVWAPRVVNTPEALEVADLVGGRVDLQAVARLCERLVEVAVEEHHDSELVEALSTAISVRYMRCFSTGVRRRLPPDFLDNLPEDLAGAHDFLRDLRNKHLAHSVNAFEENLVTVHVREPPGNPQVGGLGESHSRLGAISTGFARDVMRLCEHLVQQIVTLIESKKASIARALGALPIDEVYGLPEPDAFDPSQVDVRRARRRD